MSALDAMIEKLPMLNMDWSPELRDAWLDCVAAIQRYAERAIEEARQPTFEDFVQQRIGDSPACAKCSGLGTRCYGSTATWRGGVGGQALTSDVCDACWGSGSVHPWPSHRLARRPTVTREEAVEAIYEVLRCEQFEANRDQSGDVLRGLEALGCVKFREVKP